MDPNTAGILVLVIVCLFMLILIMLEIVAVIIDMIRDHFVYRRFLQRMTKEFKEDIEDEHYREHFGSFH